MSCGSQVAASSAAPARSAGQAADGADLFLGPAGAFAGERLWQYRVGVEQVPADQRRGLVADLVGGVGHARVLCRGGCGPTVVRPAPPGEALPGSDAEDAQPCGCATAN